MDKFLELFKTFSFTDVFAVIVLTILGIKGAAELLKTIKKDLESWYQKKRGIEKKEETLEERVKRLEENDMGQIEKLNEIENSVKKLSGFLEETVKDRNSRLDEIAEQNRQAVVAQARASLYRLAKDLDGRDHISSAEYETFRSLGDIYLSYGGNATFKHKIIPTIEALPVRDE